MLVVFDLDGTLVDSAKTMAKCWAAVQDQTGVHEIPFGSYFSHIGIPFEAILERINFPRQLISQARKVYFSTASNEAGNTPLFNGVYDMLKDLNARGVRMSILTSKTSGATEVILGKTGIRDFFECLMCPDTSPHLSWKPNPAPLMDTMLRLGEEPQTTVYVGDMSVDHDCAHRAGVFYIHAAYGYEPDYEPEYVHRHQRIRDTYGSVIVRSVPHLCMDLSTRTMNHA
jgi:phosphoglycolate phosphatase-like HAD superfamily hydrolase